MKKRNKYKRLIAKIKSFSKKNNVLNESDSWKVIYFEFMTDAIE